jgi:hypothetical protein
MGSYVEPYLKVVRKKLDGQDKIINEHH